jgi:hypothetical protein
VELTLKAPAIQRWVAARWEERRSVLEGAGVTAEVKRLMRALGKAVGIVPEAGIEEK